MKGFHPANQAVLATGAQEAVKYGARVCEVRLHELRLAMKDTVLVQHADPLQGVGADDLHEAAWRMAAKQAIWSAGGAEITDCFTCEAVIACEEIMVPCLYPAVAGELGLLPSGAIKERLMRTRLRSAQGDGAQLIPWPAERIVNGYGLWRCEGEPGVHAVQCHVALLVDRPL